MSRLKEQNETLPLRPNNGPDMINHKSRPDLDTVPHPQVMPLNPSNVFTQTLPPPFWIGLNLEPLQQQLKNTDEKEPPRNNFVGPPPEYPKKPIGPLRPQINNNNNNFNLNNKTFNDNNYTKNELTNKSFSSRNSDEFSHSFEQHRLYRRYILY